MSKNTPEQVAIDWVGSEYGFLMQNFNEVPRSHELSHTPTHPPVYYIHPHNVYTPTHLYRFIHCVYKYRVIEGYLNRVINTYT